MSMCIRKQILTARSEEQYKRDRPEILQASRTQVVELNSILGRVNYTHNPPGLLISQQQFSHMDCCVLKSYSSQGL